MVAVFLDRDGVIIEKAPEGQYVSRWENVRFIPGAIGAISTLYAAGFKIFIVTNQRGLALRKIRLEHLQEIHQRLTEKLAKSGVTVSGIYFCPHAKCKRCSCRKPKPGMLLRAAKDHGLDLQSSWLVGDAFSDIEAGRRAGCKTAWIQRSDSKLGEAVSDLVASDLVSAVRHILEIEGSHFGV
ncbi:MAG TPA: HAD family hydrolase [Terriglobales bacterium]|nr:HAD family hydrolase [Terriglobales bacterium]